MNAKRKVPPMSKVVLSPAGEEIKVLSDEQWLAMARDRVQAITLFDAKRPVLGALWNHGAYESATGQATQPLHNDAQVLGYTGTPVAINPILTTRIMVPAVKRDIRGKRTFAIRLVALPQSWFDKLNAEWPRTNGHAAVADVPATPYETAIATSVAGIIVAREIVGTDPVPLSADEQLAVNHAESLLTPPAVTIDMGVPDHTELLLAPVPEDPPMDYAPPIELTIANAVAQALITQVVEIISAGTRSDATVRIRELESNLRIVEETLAKRLDENNKLRMTNNKMNEELQMNKHRVATLGQQLRTAEYNLRQATSQDTQRFINEQVQKELAKIMSAKPSEKA